MPSPTFVAIASTELTTTTPTVVFDSIPGTYKDLFLVMTARINTATVRETFIVLPNTVTTSSTSGSYGVLYGLSGSFGAGQTDTTMPFSNIYDLVGTSAPSNMFGTTHCYITNYAGSKYKTFSSFGSSYDASANGKLVGKTSQVWKSNDAINKLTIDANADFLSGSRFDLYGIKNS